VPTEVIVVDGGSRDATVERAQGMGATVVPAERGRARQQNAGARRARGDVLLFLHADLRVPVGGLEALEAAMDDPEVVGGGFRKRYVPDGPLLAWIAWVQNRIRAGILGHLVGTNGIFVRRGVFEALGGFPEVPFLEDVLFSDHLREVGKLAILGPRLEVSSRKYRRDGALVRLLRNLWIVVQFRALGRTPEELVEQYRGKA